MLLFIAALTVGLAQETVARRIRTSGPTVKRWGGWLVALVATWFIATAVFAETFAELFPV